MHLITTLALNFFYGIWLRLSLSLAVKPVVNVCHELTAIKDTVHSHFHFQMYPKWISSCVQN